ncbi:MAG: flagellar hook-length control protein FliK [Gammaproteobacteria bacterium]|nr:flagellar hook-length control protein FliK [Gammaproteobacteria bacterium]
MAKDIANVAMMIRNSQAQVEGRETITRSGTGGSFASLYGQEVANYKKEQKGGYLSNGQNKGREFSGPEIKESKNTFASFNLKKAENEATLKAPTDDEDKEISSSTEGTGSTILKSESVTDSAQIAVTNTDSEQNLRKIVSNILQLPEDKLQALMDDLKLEFGDQAEAVETFIDAIKTLQQKPGLLEALTHSEKGIGLYKALGLGQGSLGGDQDDVIKALGKHKDEIIAQLSELKGFIEEHSEFFAEYLEPSDLEASAVDVASGVSANTTTQKVETSDEPSAKTENTRSVSNSLGQTASQEGDAQGRQNHESHKGISETVRVEKDIEHNESTQKSDKDFKSALTDTNRAAMAAQSKGLAEALENTNPRTPVAELIERMTGVGQATTASGRAQNSSGMPSFFLQQSVFDEEWSAGFAQRVGMMLNAKFQQAEIRLNPPDLGPVTVRINLQGDQASVAFSAQHGAVREAIEAAIPRLREMMNESGLNLANVDVNTQSGQQGREHASNNDAQGEASLAQSHNGEGFFDEAEMGNHPAQHHIRSDRLLDIYA